MKKKMLICFITILIIALVLVLMYIVDMYMMNNNCPVIFSTWGYDYAPPEILGDVVNIEDKTIDNNNISFATALEKIFEDEKNKYYLGCIKSEYIIVKYENGYEENIKSALKEGRITIQDLDRFNIAYITQEKEIQYLKSFIGTVLEETSTHIVVRPNANEFEIKSADKIVINYDKEHKGNLYGIDSKVVISYNGEIMESYPAIINAKEISLLD